VKGSKYSHAKREAKVHNPISIVIWRDAQKDPPFFRGGEELVTDKGVFLYGNVYDGQTPVETWYYEGAYYQEVYRVKTPPKLWYSPEPPRVEVSVADLQRVIELAAKGAEGDDLLSVTRLRDALEAAVEDLRR